MVEKGPNRKEVGGAEYKLLSSDAVAVVSGKVEYVRESVPIQKVFAFRVDIGRVEHRDVANPRDYAKLEDALEQDDYDVSLIVPRGKHAGMLGIAPLEYKWIEIELLNDSNRLRLGICYYGDSDTHVSQRLYGSKSFAQQEEVGAAIFRENGFDLDFNNQDNHGLVLNQTLSQYLYDFQSFQGEFAPNRNRENKYSSYS